MKTYTLDVICTRFTYHEVDVVSWRSDGKYFYYNRLNLSRTYKIAFSKIKEIKINAN